MSRDTKLIVSLILLGIPVGLFLGCGDAGSNAESGAMQAPTVAPSITQSAAGNQAPTISRIGDEYARVGETYSLTPAVRDPDGDSLSYSADNLPPWASLDPTSGLISGTPGAADVGVYESITIKVADSGRATNSAPFCITVLDETAAGVASLRWESPPSKVDGSPLDDLAGYRIVYGRKADDLDRSVFVDDPAVTNFEFTGLTAGLWYFSVIAVNANGLEGPPTTVTQKSI